MSTDLGLPRVVELVRVSTDGQREKATHEVQRQALDVLRKQRPGVVVRRLEALGVSGAKGIADRDDLQELERLSRDKAYDELRVFSVDRLTRSDDPRERFAVYGLVADAGAKIVDCNGRVIDPRDEMGELDLYLQGLFAARERKKISQRTIAGRRIMASQGKLAHGIPPYGRRFNRAAQAWEVVESELEVYRGIVAACLDGKGYTEIARELNRRGVPSKRDGWGHTSIRNLLTRSTIVGEYLSHGHTIQIPPICTREEWNAIKSEIARRNVRPAETQEIPALLRGRLICGACGMAAWVSSNGGDKGFPRYCCPKPSRRNGLPPCPDRRTVRVVEADEAVYREILGQDPNDIARRFDRDAKAEEDPQEALERLRKSLAKVFADEARTLHRENNGQLSEETASREYARIKAERVELEGQIKLHTEIAQMPKTLGPVDVERDKVIAKLVPVEPGYGLTLMKTGIEIRGRYPVTSTFGIGFRLFARLPVR